MSPNIKKYPRKVKWGKKLILIVIIDIVDITCENVCLPVPVTYVLLWPPELIPKAHADDIGGIPEHGGDTGEPGQPHLRIEVCVAEEAVAVGVAAAPLWLAYMVV